MQGHATLGHHPSHRSIEVLQTSDSNRCTLHILKGDAEEPHFQNKYVSMVVIRLKIEFMIYCLVPLIWILEKDVCHLLSNHLPTTSEEAVVYLLSVTYQLFIPYAVAQFVLAAKKLHSCFVSDHNTV